MMTLISLAIAVAFATSLASTFGLFEVEIWWELSALITIMLLGHWLEMRSIAQASGAPGRVGVSCCRVADGAADVDESMITGESSPVPREPGDRVAAGTVAAGGSLRVRVTAVGEGTALSGMTIRRCSSTG